MTRSVFRPIGDIRMYAFSFSKIRNIFSQLKLLFNTLKIKGIRKIFDFEEIGFTPGRDVAG